MATRRGGSARKGYHVKRTPQGVYSITIPAAMGVLIPKDARFKARFTPQGIEFELVDQSPEPPPYVPNWTEPF